MFLYYKGGSKGVLLLTAYPEDMSVAVAGLRVPEQHQASRLHLYGVVDLQQLLAGDGGGKVKEFASDGVLEVAEGGVEEGGALPCSSDVVVGAIGGGGVESQVVQRQRGRQGNILDGTEQSPDL